MTLLMVFFFLLLVVTAPWPVTPVSWRGVAWLCAAVLWFLVLVHVVGFDRAL